MVAKQSQLSTFIESKDRPGRIPALEQIRISASYWWNEARNKQEERRGDVLMYAEQAINAWKNAAYAAHDKLNGLKPVGLFWQTVGDGKLHFCEGNLKRGDIHDNGKPIKIAYAGEEAE